MSICWQLKWTLKYNWIKVCFLLLLKWSFSLKVITASTHLHVLTYTYSIWKQVGKSHLICLENITSSHFLSLLSWYASLPPFLPPLQTLTITLHLALQLSMILALYWMWRGHLDQAWREHWLNGRQVIGHPFCLPRWTGFSRGREQEAEWRSMSGSEWELFFFFISPHQSRGSAREPSLIEFQFNHFLKVIIQYLFKSQRCAGLKIKSGIAWHCRFYMSQVCGCACGWALRISVGHNKLFLTLLMNVSSTFVRPDAWAGATSSPVPGLSPVQWLSQSQS